MNRDCDWMIRKKREKSVGVHGSSVRTVIRRQKGKIV